MSMISVLFASLILSMSSCAQKEPGDSVPPRILKEFGAVIPDSLSRASVQIADGKVSFENGDAIVIGNGRESKEFIWDSATGTFKNAEGIENTGSFTAFYPASIVQDIAADGTVSITLPDTRVYTEGVVREIPMSATSSTAKLDFHNLCTILAVRMNGDQKLSSLKFTAAQKAVAGNATVKDNVLSIEPTQKKSLTLSVADTPVLSSQTPVFIVLPAQVYTGGFTVDVSLQNGDSFSKSSVRDIPLQASVISMMKAFDAFLFSGGAGTEDNPYKIGRSTDIKDLVSYTASADADRFRGKHYLQTADIDMSSEGTLSPICSNSSKPFSGHYDGGNHSIAGLKVTSASAAGLFAYADGATIRNVSLKGCNVTSTGGNVGVVAGYSCGAGSTIEHCFVDAASSVRGSDTVGGILGKAEGSTTLNCNVCRADITSKAGITGGIVGMAYGTAGTASILIINNIYDTGTITNTKASGNVFSGGIAGSAHGGGSNKKIDIVNNFAFPDLICNTGASANVMSGLVGGVITSNVSIYNCISPVNYSNFAVSGKRLTYKTFTGLNYISGTTYFKADGALNHAFTRFAFKVSSKESSVTPVYNNICYRTGDPSFKNFAKVVYSYHDSGVPDSWDTMKEALDEFAARWNANHDIKALMWEPDITNDGYLKPAGLSPVNPDPPLRISLMGDSICAMSGDIYADHNFQYNRYYPHGSAEDAVSTQVLSNREMWYYRFIYEKLGNARLEVNDSFSGSTVCYMNVSGALPRSLEYCFLRRFERLPKLEIGNPDLVIIYGGANDYWIAGNNDSYLGSKDTMEGDFAKTDIRDIPETNFYSAMVRLMRGIHDNFPAARILLIEHDNISDGFTRAGTDLMNFFNSKPGYDVNYVPLHKIGTTPSYTGSGVVDIDKQGSDHPSKAGAVTLADYVYQKVGAWIENQ